MEAEYWDKDSDNPTPSGAFTPLLDQLLQLQMLLMVSS